MDTHNAHGVAPTHADITTTHTSPIDIQNHRNAASSIGELHLKNLEQPFSLAPSSLSLSSSNNTPQSDTTTQHSSTSKEHEGPSSAPTEQAKSTSRTSKRISEEEMEMRKWKKAKGFKMNASNEKHAINILASLLKNPWSTPFETPVDPVALSLPGYMDMVKHPMDLSTILKMLNDKRYTTVNQFADDVRLVFNNAILYYDSRSDIHKAARGFITEFEELMKTTPWNQDSTLPVTSPIVAISKHTAAKSPSSAVEKITKPIPTEITHIEEPKSQPTIVPIPVTKVGSETMTKSRTTRAKHGVYNCLVFYQSESIPYDFEWPQVNSRDDLEQKLRAVLNIPSVVELEIGIKRSKPNFGKAIFVQISPRWDEFPHVAILLVKHKKYAI